MILSATSLTPSENLENQPNLNQIYQPIQALQPLQQQQQQTIQYKIITDLSSINSKNDDILEAETRGIDAKGNVRYFCPRCNVRYIGENFKYLIKKYSILFCYRIQIPKDSSKRMWKCFHLPRMSTEI